MKPPPLYGIADAQALHPKTLAEGVEAMASGGLRWVQVRAKNMSGDRLFHQVEECCRRLERLQLSGVVDLWVNDRVDLAALFPGVAVHLGQEDLEAGWARRILGDRHRIGLSTHDFEQVRLAEGDPAVDVVAFGPIFPTQSKEQPDPVVGLEGLRSARRLTTKPLVAIGGIDGDNLGQVLDAGADTAALIRAVCVGKVSRNCRNLLARVEGR